VRKKFGERGTVKVMLLQNRREGAASKVRQRPRGEKMEQENAGRKKGSRIKGTRLGKSDQLLEGEIKEDSKTARHK